MSLNNDFTALMGVWGQSLTVVRATVAYSDSGAGTKTWATVDTKTGMIQPHTGRGESPVLESGQRVQNAFDVFLPTGTTVREGDRIRPTGWSAGQDEYHVVSVDDFGISNLQALCEVVKGRGN